MPKASHSDSKAVQMFSGYGSLWRREQRKIQITCLSAFLNGDCHLILNTDTSSWLSKDVEKLSA